nr:abscisic aldehyde oxidase 3 [Tanacetum cinerariifolium]
MTLLEKRTAIEEPCALKKAKGNAIVGYNMEDLESFILTMEQAVGRSSFFEVPSILYPSQIVWITIDSDFWQGKIQIGEEAALGRGKGQRKVGSYREAYAPKPMDTPEKMPDVDSDFAKAVIKERTRVLGMTAKKRVDALD